MPGSFCTVPTPDPALPRLSLSYNVSDNPAAWHRHILAFCARFGADALPYGGLPITGMVKEGGRLVQYVERARIEVASDGRVDLGLVGTELLALRNWDAV